MFNRFFHSVNFARLVTFIVFIMSSVVLVAQNDRTKKLDEYFSTLARNGEFNGNVLVAEHGTIIYEKEFGYADFTRSLNTRETSFPIASVTKTMTSTAILQLMEKNKLKLEDPYIKYFPTFPYPSVTISELLSHTSRIPSSQVYRLFDSIRKEKDTFFTNNDIIPALVLIGGELPAPGGKIRADFSYSNINYHLLALLIEKLSGLPFNSYLKKFIFIPAGMNASSLSEFYFGMDKNLAREQRYKFMFSDEPEMIDTVKENQHIFSTYNLKGHGDVVSTAIDLYSYHAALQTRKLLKEETLQKAYTPVVPGDGPNSGYGLGWSIRPDSSHGKIVFHHGGGLGVEVMFVRVPSRDQVVILFDNTKKTAFEKALNALKILNGQYVALPKKSIARVYGRAVKDKTEDRERILRQLLQDTANYYITEDEMNVLGYQFLWNELNKEALEVLGKNVQLFPLSWNSYDSYGEILLKVGRKKEAIRMYRKSIEMNPNNEEGKKILRRIEIEK